MKRGECIENDPRFSDLKSKLVSIPKADPCMNLVGSTSHSHYPAHNPSLTECVPAWDIYDKHVLRFYGFYEEVVPESSLESRRVRRVVILYYLEDDTVAMTEPREVNSGMQQGTILKRQRLSDLTIENLIVGREVSVYGREIKLVSVDEYTRDYYASMDIIQPDSISVPVDSYAQAVQRKTEKVSSNLPSLGKSVHIDSQRVTQFLDNDRKVCRFYAILDMDNERRTFVILYYLADNTVELREQFAINSGRDDSSIFFRRGKVNVKGHPVGPGLKTDESNLMLTQFAVGDTVDLIYNKFFVYDADKFTREWLLAHYQTVLEDRIDPSLSEASARPKAAIPTPPYTGFGSWDDSMGSVFALSPKQPQKDLFKLFVNEGKVLRVNCEFVNPSVEDQVRRFVISYFLADDHVSIHEPSVRNSGIVGGKFLEKGVYMNASTGKLVVPSDLAVGRTVEIVGRKFIVRSCDKYTQRYFEDPSGGIKSGSAIVPIANEVRRKLYQMMPLIHDTFRKLDRDGKSVITIDKFREILLRFGFILSDKDSLAIMQLFDANQNGLISYLEFCDMIYQDDIMAGIDGGTCEGLVPLAEYELRSEQSLDAKQEEEKVKRALREVSGLVYSRQGLSQRLMKELGIVANHSRFVDSEQLRAALMNLGLSVDQRDVDRVVEALSGAGEGIQKFDFFHFLKNVNCMYHKLH